jgi:hypothetical protein
VLTLLIYLPRRPPGTGKVTKLFTTLAASLTYPHQSFTGVEILRVLKANNVGPILMIAFTNHALDHMLCSVLDADITRKIVRLGSRSSDERISQYSIETLEMVDGRSRLDRTFGGRRRNLKDVQQDIKNLMEKVINLDVDSDSVEIMKYILAFHPEHHESLEYPPSWISTFRMIFDNDDDKGSWKVQGRRGKSHIQDTSFYAYWKDCGDLDGINAVVDGSLASSMSKPEEAPVVNKFNVLPVEVADDSKDGDDEDDDSESESSDDGSVYCNPEESWMKVQYDLPLQTTENEVKSTEDQAAVLVNPPSNSETSEDQPGPNMRLGPADFKDPEGFLAAIGCKRKPAVPTSNRPLEELLDQVVDVWSMSRSERRRLHEFWAKETRIELVQNQNGEFERLHELHAQMLRECNEGKEEVSTVSVVRSLTDLLLGSTNSASKRRYHRLHNNRYILPMNSWRCSYRG